MGYFYIRSYLDGDFLIFFLPTVYPKNKNQKWPETAR